jgi:hypothetical protein
MKRAIILCLFIAVPTFAQEYGRASAGAIDLTPKSGNAFDGSFSLSSARSLGATFGGSVVKDRVWFFGSADRVQPMIRTTAMPTSTADLSAVLSKTRPAGTMPMSMNALTLPKDFLSLHSTMMFSPSSAMTLDIHSTR